MHASKSVERGVVFVFVESDMWEFFSSLTPLILSDDDGSSILYPLLVKSSTVIFRSARCKC